MGAGSFDAPVKLPHTDLTVGPIGLGSSYGLDADGVELAFELGVNFFYWGSLRRESFGEGLRRLARRDRDGVVIALQSYARWPAGQLRRSVERGLRRLRLDYADVLILGWHNRRPSQRLLDAAAALRERGLVRYLMMSGHQRTLFPGVAEENLFEILMVRYNAAHRGAEQEVFPELPSNERRPAICAYTATRWGRLLDSKKMPPGERVPRGRDCYRFCLTHPAVDMVLCGPRDQSELREACGALDEGPLDADELAWMQRVGDHVHRGGKS